MVSSRAVNQQAYTSNQLPKLTPPVDTQQKNSVEQLSAGVSLGVDWVNFRSWIHTLQEWHEDTGPDCYRRTWAMMATALEQAMQVLQAQQVVEVPGAGGREA